MKLMFLGGAAALAFSLSSILAAEPAVKPADGSAASDAASGLKSQKEKGSYAVGINIGRGFKQQGVEMDIDTLVRGIKDGIAGKEGVLSDADRQAALLALQQDVQASITKKGEESKKAGDAFLAENKKKEGIVTLPSGLQYKVIKQGTGPKPKATDTVETNYRGTLTDGTEFDSSYKRGETAKFPVGEVIKGWTEALQLMPVGSKWQLYIPSDLAYGDQGTPGGPIPPNAALVFDIELIAIK